MPATAPPRAAEVDGGDGAAASAATAMRSGFYGRHGRVECWCWPTGPRRSTTNDAARPTARFF